MTPGSWIALTASVPVPAPTASGTIRAAGATAWRSGSWTSIECSPRCAARSAPNGSAQGQDLRRQIRVDGDVAERRSPGARSPSRPRHAARPRCGSCPGSRLSCHPGPAASRRRARSRCRRVRRAARGCQRGQVRLGRRPGRRAAARRQHRRRHPSQPRPGRRVEGPGDRGRRDRRVLARAGTFIGSPARNAARRTRARVPRPRWRPASARPQVGHEPSAVEVREDAVTAPLDQHAAAPARTACPRGRARGHCRRTRAAGRPRGPISTARRSVAIGVGGTSSIRNAGKKRLTCQGVSGAQVLDEPARQLAQLARVVVLAGDHEGRDLQPRARPAICLQRLEHGRETRSAAPAVEACPRTTSGPRSRRQARAPGRSIASGVA